MWSMENQSSSEDDDYGGGYHRPGQRPARGEDSDEEPRPVYRPSAERLEYNLMLKPKLSDLMVLRTIAGDYIRVLKKVKRRWKDFSVYSEVDEDGEITKTVESKHGSQGYDSCCLDMMRRWLDNGGLKPATWATFIEILQDMNLMELSLDVHRALHYRIDRR